MSEDCLYLNVTTAARSATDKLPVMVWFHGGGNTAGVPGTTCTQPLATVAGSDVIVDDIDVPGSGPVLFEDGSPGSNLSYSFISLGSSADDVSFSDDGGLTYNYTPTPDAAGCDAAVTHLDINPTGQFAADTGSGSPSVTFRFRLLRRRSRRRASRSV